MQDSVVRSLDGTPVDQTTSPSSTLTDQAPAESSMKSALMTWGIVAIVGMTVGFGLAQMANNSSSGPSMAPQATTTAKSAGIKDEKRFPDKAEGKLVKGGIDGEGSYHLERRGGESQNVYLTSSIVDLSEYTGKNVRVWGETFAGQKAGWLMDVGYVEKL